MTSIIAPPHYIDTQAAFSHWVDRFRTAPVLAVDTESDSFHHYREKVCLIQMSAFGEDVIIDPLAVPDISPLGELLSNPGQIKIFHDACYDLICLRRDYGFQISNIFDTMVASRLLGWRQFGLGAILQEQFAFPSDKRFQRSDWARRPLSPEQLAYARFDTHFLQRLMDLLRQQLHAQGRLAWAEEDFSRLPSIAERVGGRRSGGDPDGFWRIRGVKSLPPKVRGRIKALCEARDRIAERLDRPPFKVLNDDVLIELAKHPPRVLAELQPRPGLRRAGIERFGAELMAALDAAEPIVGGPPPGTVKRRSGRYLDPEARGRYEALRQLRRTTAEALGLDPEVALGNATLETLARQPPKLADDMVALPELNGWRRPFFAESIVTLMQQLQQQQGQAPASGEALDDATPSEPQDTLLSAKSAYPIVTA